MFQKTKTNLNDDEGTDFYDKVDSYQTCLAVIRLDYALKKDDSYYLQVVSKECKCIEKTSVRHITDKLSDFSYSCDEFDEE